MIGNILLGGLFWVLGTVGLWWGLRLRRGEGRLPSERWGKANAVGVFWADPDRNILAGSIFGLGIATFMTALGIFMAIPFGPLAKVIVAVGAAAFVGSGLLWLSLATINRPRGLLPPNLRKRVGGSGANEQCLEEAGKALRRGR